MAAISRTCIFEHGPDEQYIAKNTPAKTKLNITDSPCTMASKGAVPQEQISTEWYVLAY